MCLWRELRWISESAKQIGRDIGADFEQLRFTGGFDHNYVTDGYNKASIREDRICMVRRIRNPDGVFSLSMRTVLCGKLCGG